MTAQKWYNGLRVQIVCLLTLALLPLGTIAIYQTNRVATEAERKAELALLALTERAANAEALIIARAIGSARGLAATATKFLTDPALCKEELGTLVSLDNGFSFIGFLPLNGEMTCTSSGQTYDFSQWPEFAATMEAQERTITVNQDAPLSGQSVFIVSEPYQINGAFAGMVSLSIPHVGLPDLTVELSDLGLQELVTFSDDGTLLTARSDLNAAQTELPGSRTLVELAGTSDLAFTEPNRAGENRTYTVVQIKGSPATVLGAWRTEDGVARRAQDFIRPGLFPVLMWFASMAVALLSIYTLVLRPITRLRRDMDSFAINRKIISDRPDMSMPNEFASLNENFSRMTDDILRDEARLENSVREKNVLIKEVHHRVKNNLQLISSIMNMQIRTAAQEETKIVLSRLQDRILSLATIHRDLYQSQHGGRVDVGALVTEVVQKSLEVATETESQIDIYTDIDPVLLYPDQAVPLSLLTAEGVTNAIKYLGAAPGNKPWIKATLKQSDADCVLTLANSIGSGVGAESTGLGAQLIKAFAIQLGGRIDIDAQDESYKMTVQFKAADFSPETPDY